MKQKISKFLRKVRLIYLTDWLVYLYNKNKNKTKNNQFKANNPTVILPPDYLIYESFQIDYTKYYTDSIETAKWLSVHFGKYINLKQEGLKILDWGCGPGRIIRHLPTIIGEKCEYYGTDYNKNSIDWCKKNLPEINFNLNSLEAKLPYKDDSFDVIYGISIFTHLSEELHYNWFKELKRVLSPKGIMFITTQGDAFKVKLTPEESIRYDNGNIVIRGSVKEGHRTYSAFHPKKFMTHLFNDISILDHIETPHVKSANPQQDIWIIRK